MPSEAELIALGEDGGMSFVHLCSFTDGRDYTIRVGDRTYFFEWSDRFGPLFVGARGQEVDNHKILTSAFRAVSIWKRQGMRTERQGKHLRAIWEEPPDATYYFIRLKRGREIVESVEPLGYDADYSREVFIDVTDACATNNPENDHG